MEKGPKIGKPLKNWKNYENLKKCKNGEKVQKIVKKWKNVKNHKKIKKQLCAFSCEFSRISTFMKFLYKFVFWRFFTDLLLKLWFNNKKPQKCWIPQKPKYRRKTAKSAKKRERKTAKTKLRKFAKNLRKTTRKC